jgi:ppGpp synthetase/RelA/SpoT-type nucleotidyltranferase
MLGTDVRGTCGSCGAEVASSEVYCLIHAPMQRAGENALCTEPKARGNEKAVAKASKNRPDENAPGIEPKVHIKKKVIAKASENRLDENAPYIEPKARDDEKAVANASENRPDSALNSFLEDYNDNSKYYKELATHVEGICREILDKMEIKGLVTSRAKDCKSLQEKLPKRTKKWGDKVASKKDVEEKIHDLAGVRMTLYFPDDVPEVTSVVTEVFERVIDPIVRTANREDARNVHNQAVEGTTGNQGSVSESSRTAELQSDVDKQRKQMAPLPSEYTHGPWRSLSVNDIVHHWKHSGYRAVHLVLKLKETTGRDVSKVISDVRNVNKDDNRPQLSENNKLTDRQVALARLRNIGITKVEIQVITVVMHAWSEVEHDIIYKNKYGLPESSRMNRMLDGINGLSSMQFCNFTICLSPSPTVLGVLKRASACRNSRFHYFRSPCTSFDLLRFQMANAESLT